MSGEPDAGLKTSYYLLMVYAALFGALSSLLTVGYITLYNLGIKFFEQGNLFVFNINIWPLVLLTGAGVLIGLAIKFFGNHGGPGVAQREYAQTGRFNYRNTPRIMLQAFIALWSGAPVGPEAPLVFLTGGFGSFVSERLKLQKDDIQVLVYSSLAGAFGAFIGSPIIGAIAALWVHVHQGAQFLSPCDTRTCRCSSGLWYLWFNLAERFSGSLQLPRLPLSRTWRPVVGSLGRSHRRRHWDHVQTDIRNCEPRFHPANQATGSLCYHRRSDPGANRFIPPFDTLLRSGSVATNNT